MADSLPTNRPWHQRLGGRLIAIALEQSRGAVIHALMMDDFLVLYPINPKALARYREAFCKPENQDGSCLTAREARGILAPSSFSRRQKPGRAIMDELREAPAPELKWRISRLRTAIVFFKTRVIKGRYSL